MAARTGAGTGVVVGLVVFVIMSVLLLVLTIVFYTKQAEAVEARIEAEEQLSDYANRAQRNSDAYKAVEAQAQASGKTAMQHLIDQKQQIMTRVLGNPNASVDELQSTLATYAPGSPNASCATALRSLSGELQASRTEGQGYRDQITQLEDLVAEKNAMLEQAEDQRQQEVQAVRNLIATFMQDVQNYGVEVQETRQAMMNMVQELENTFDTEVDQLERTLDQLRTELALKESRLAEYQEIVNETRLKAKDPALLVDGRILDNATGQGLVYITLRMPRGKASVQVIEVGETTSTAKITRSSRGRPVVRDDVIANAVYDPEKEYLFMVHGRFDMNTDGRPTPAETDLVKSLIREWGGEIYEGDELRGDIDFLLLGVQPNEPGPLPDNPTPAQVDIWVKQKEAVERYNQLLNRAMQANIPVLNQNRFLVLIGHTNR